MCCKVFVKTYTKHVTGFQFSVSDPTKWSSSHIPHRNPFALLTTYTCGNSTVSYSFVFSVPSAVNLSCVNLFEDVRGGLNITVSWTLSDEDSADFYLINITTSAPQTPYGGLLNITTASVTQYELTGFLADHQYNITVRVNCGGLEGSESEPLIITPLCK